MRRQIIPGLPTATAIGLLSFAPPAAAYLDPSTGGLILSAIVGLLATIGLTFKTWWYRFKALFRKQAPGAPPTAGRSGGDDAAAGRDGPAGR